MRIDVLSLFPEIFPCYLNTSILSRAQESKLVAINLQNIRDYAEGKHRVTDEPPFGGGGGMVLKPEPIFAAVEELLQHSSTAADEERATILLTPQGRLFDQTIARELAAKRHIILICGRYEGVDERVREYLVTDELSIGDYVLTGGELAALVVIDAITRLMPGALGDEKAAEVDSHATGLLEGPHYTRPADFRGWRVPDVLRSGHAAKIAQWRRQQSLRRTWERRPELLLDAGLSEDDQHFLANLARESAEKARGRSKE